MQVLNKEYLSWLFDYDRENGKLYWKNHWHKGVIKRFKGKEVRNVNNEGYKRAKINGITIQVHRIIFFLETGRWVEIVDHIDGNKLNNKSSNLRQSNERKNQQNRRSHRQGRLVGTSFRKDRQLWIAQIEIQGHQKHLGYFKTELEAHRRYMQELKARGLA